MADALAWIQPVLQFGIGNLLSGLISFLAFISVAVALVCLWRPILRRIVFGLLIPLLRSMDWFLVVFGTRVVGTRIRNSLLRWAILIGWLFTMGMFGAFLPLQLGYPALLVGVTAIMIVFRHWTWDENDVEDQVPVEERRIAIAGNLRNEMLVSVAFLFLYAPIAFAKLPANDAGFSLVPGAGILTFVQYTFLELLKALPFIDYYEMFGDELRFERYSNVSSLGLNAKFLTLALRASFDLVLIASLMRLPVIAKHEREGRDLRPIDEKLASNDEASQLEAVKQLRLFALKRRAFTRERLVEVSRQRLFGDQYRYNAQIRLQSANALSDIGDRLGDVSGLYAAIAAYNEILKEYTRERAPTQWADTQNSLGSALYALANLGGDERLFLEAIAAYRQALIARTEQDVPLDWAQSQSNLGAALRRLGAMRGDPSLLEEALKAYDEALKQYTRQAAPFEWAAVQNNRGIALGELGALRGDPQLTEQAAGAYRAALQIWTRKRGPMDWARAQNNLGTALYRLGEHHSDARRTEEAVYAYREALKEWTRERVPLDWAMTQNNLGAALWLLGNLRTDEKVMQEALYAYREALKEYTREHAPSEWAATQNNLGIVLARLGTLRGSSKFLEQSIVAYQEALTEWTRDRTPLKWAMVQSNLGGALRALGVLRTDGALLESAVAAYGEALMEYTRERTPFDWAVVQYNMGIALRHLGSLRRSAALIEAAIAAYDRSIEVFEQVGATAYADQARAALRIARGELEALETNALTVASSDLLNLPGGRAIAGWTEAGESRGHRRAS